jgi:hypothetical protein
MTTPDLPASALPPALSAALEEARALAGRGWSLPAAPTVDEARRLLGLVNAAGWRAPTTVQAEADGSLTLEWDAGARGWLQFSVVGSGQLVHSGVIEGDEYAQDEAFAERLPDWADALLRRLLGTGH